MPISDTLRAQFYVRAGQLDRALDSLERAYQKRESALAWVNVEPTFDALRARCAFQRIAAQRRRPLLNHPRTLSKSSVRQGVFSRFSPFPQDFASAVAATSLVTRGGSDVQDRVDERRNRLVGRAADVVGPA
jgi:hypothetical protein